MLGALLGPTPIGHHSGEEADQGTGVARKETLECAAISRLEGQHQPGAEPGF